MTVYGARNIVVLVSHSQSAENKKFLQRNLSIIKAHKSVVSIESIEVPFDKPDFVIQHILYLKLSNIAGMLIFSNGNDESDERFIKKIQNIISTHIVLLNCVSNVQLNLERYHTKNVKNVSFLRWDKSRRFHDVLRSLSSALEETVDIFVRRDTMDETDVIVTNFSFQGKTGFRLPVLKHTNIILI